MLIVLLGDTDAKCACYDGVSAASIPIYRWHNSAVTIFGGVLFKSGNLILKIIYE